MQATISKILASPAENRIPLVLPSKQKLDGSGISAQAGGRPLIKSEHPDRRTTGSAGRTYTLPALQADLLSAAGRPALAGAGEPLGFLHVSPPKNYTQGHKLSQRRDFAGVQASVWLLDFSSASDSNTGAYTILFAGQTLLCKGSDTRSVTGVTPVVFVSHISLFFNCLQKALLCQAGRGGVFSTRSPLKQK
ncbi:MAG: hypothetical protein LV479_04395 [Methylacidiphilales bacterium]|nr:hypothetical protein [Candidatus Methylacidiphilales bacterium]